MPSDDTLMAAVTLQALYGSGGDERKFAFELARRLRRWFWTIPPGIGLATIKASLRLSVGLSPFRSGVPAQGNGPAVRAVVLGCAVADDPIKMEVLINASTRITHTHPVAIEGALIAGEAAALVVKGFRAELPKLLKEAHPGWRWDQGYPDDGPTGYMVYTINAAIQCCEMHPGNPSKGIEAAIGLGGDTDSVAAVVGGILGAAGQTIWPVEWQRWIGWPNASNIAAIAHGRELKLPAFRLHVQNALCLLVILPHIIRRMLPPY
jgi:ADP-ribosylglycohydrolase